MVANFMVKLQLRYLFAEILEIAKKQAFIQISQVNS